MKTLEISSKEAAEALVASGNLNSAIKNFLKIETGHNARTQKFAKSLRVLAKKSNNERVVALVDQYMPDIEGTLYSISSYLYAGMLSDISAKVVDKYADEFNETYEIDEGELEIKDKKKFESIVKAAFDTIDSVIKENEFEKSNFLTNLALVSIFDAELTPQIIEIIQ